MSWSIVFILFIAATGIQFFFWGIVFNRPNIFKSRSYKNSLPLEPVSVVICARNEVDNLRQNFPTVIQQDYPEFEIIVVDDASTDKTNDVLHDFGKNHSHVRVHEILAEQKKHPGKKDALHQGISLAKYDWILVTDADCFPTSDKWITHMMQSRNEETELVLGIAPFSLQEGFVNAWARFENLLTAIQYISLADAGEPYMGVGRNLLYKKALYETVGYSSHADMISGDDDLFVNQVANAKNTEYCLNQGAQAKSYAPNSWSNYWRQKGRHVVTGRKYSPKHQFILSLYAGSHFLHYALGMLCLCNASLIILVLLMYAMRQALIYMRIRKWLNKLVQARKGIFTLPMDFVVNVYYIGLTLRIWRSNKTTTWKGFKAE